MSRKIDEYPLTYFTDRIRDELDSILFDLKIALYRDFKDSEKLTNKILYLFVEDFKPEVFSQYSIELSDKLIAAIRKTLDYTIDTEYLIRHIQNKLKED